MSSSTAANNQTSNRQNEGQEPESKRRKQAEKLPSGCALQKEVTLYHVLESDYVAEDMWMPAVLLNIKKNEERRTVSLFSRGGNQSKQSFGNSESQYDRIMLLGCLSTGTCFAILSTAAKKSSALLKLLTDNRLCIGQCIILLEPRFTGRTLGRDDALPMLDVRKAFEPYFPNSIPLRQFSPPTEPGTRYFWLYKAKIEVVNAVMVKGSCAGFLCDGQGLRNNEKGCSCCLYTRGRSTYVLQLDVKVLGSKSSEILSMDNYSSWNFTKMMINSLNQASKLEDFTQENEKKMRGCIKEIVKFVNDNDGWDVCGWMRRGIQVDATERDKKIGEEVSAESVSPHIILLKPTDASPDFIRDQMGYRVETMKVR